MANKHICCLKPRRCSVCKIQMRYSSDTLCVRSLGQLSSWKYSLLPHWTGKLVCMGVEPCCGRCIVLCRVKEEQQIHFMNYWRNRPGKGKCCLVLVGRLDLWVAQHSAFQPCIDRGVLLMSILDTPGAVSVTYTHFVSWPRECAASIVWRQPHLALKCYYAKPHILFCIFETILTVDLHTPPE